MPRPSPHAARLARLLPVLTFVAGGAAWLACDSGDNASPAVPDVEAGAREDAAVAVTGDAATDATDASKIADDGDAPDAALDAALDAATGSSTTTHLLLFGGFSSADGGVPLGDTWTFDGTSWTRHDVPGPAARWGSVGGARGTNVTLYGGAGVVVDGGQSLGDTWTWDGTSWASVSVAGPPARELAEGASVGDTFYVYGGYDNEGNGPTDLWSFDGAHWTELEPNDGVADPAPGAPHMSIGFAACAYARTLFLTGGAYIFTFDGARWTSVADGGALAGPDDRENGSCAALGSNVVFFGGASDSSGNGTEVYDDTWSWNGSAWSAATNGPHPSARSAAMMATLGDRVVLFGGTDENPDGGANIDFADTWTWNGTAWTELTIPGAVPSPRSSALLVAY